MLRSMFRVARSLAALGLWIGSIPLFMLAERVYTWSDSSLKVAGLQYLVVRWGAAIAALGDF